MQEFWGDVRPCPTSGYYRARWGLPNNRRSFAIVAYTPGHAIHHVAYLDNVKGLADVGDSAGERFLANADHPTTLRRTSISSRRESADRLRRWQPSAVVLSHFGVFMMRSRISPK